MAGDYHGRQLAVNVDLTSTSSSPLARSPTDDSIHASPADFGWLAQLVIAFRTFSFLAERCH
jgi:hypothetical protein